ncbi:MAG: M20 family metallopeptidase [Burkholderiaceae bacterium]|nr:M20 family metallopeptidase [Burkholderiaceae bacterium]
MSVVERSSDELVAGISAWIACESPSHDPASLEAMAAIVEAHGRAAGLTVRRIDLGPQTGPALVLSNRAPDDQRTGLLLLAHYDTVHPVGTLERNALRVEDGKLYGPGTYDMKAGTYLALTALGDLSAAGSTAMPVDFLIVPDEELGSTWSRGLIESHARSAKYVLVCEPARANTGHCVTARKGTGLVSVVAHGRPAHAGVAHEKGRSAIRELCHQILALEAMTDYAADVTVSVGKIEGGTTTNVVPDYARAVADFRVPTPEAGERLLAKMRALTSVDPAVRIEVVAKMNRPPMTRTEAVGKLLTTVQALAAEVGMNLQEAPMTGGGSDANFAAAVGVPALDGLGAEGDGAHTLFEHVIVATLAQRLAFWQLMLHKLV